MRDDFVFDGQVLSDFGYMICSFDSSGINNSTVSSMTYAEVKSPVSNVSHKVADSYDDNLSRVIQICKNPCISNEDMNITNDDLSELTRWLCRKDYKWFKWINDNDDDEIFHEVKCDVQKIELADKNIGFEITIKSNRPYGVTKEIIINRNIEKNETIDINVFSDEEGYIYPDVQLIVKEAGKLELCNQYENRTTILDNCIENEMINFYGKDIQQILTTNSNHVMCDDFNYKFPRLCNSYRKSKNTISFSLPCEVQIKYRGIRKVGI